MSLGITPPSADLFRSTKALCEPKRSATSIYRLLAEQGHRLFADEAFADLFEDVGRRSVPPRIVAAVMVLQRIEGASDREAVDRFAFDLRWKYASGVDLDYAASCTRCWWICGHAFATASAPTASSKRRWRWPRRRVS